jgi:hypothetical protein
MSQIPVSDHDVLVPSFKQSWVHSKLLGLALPLIITNVSLPLIGLVDTAVLGHMGQVEQLAGASVAAFIVTCPGWVKTLAFRRRLQHDMPLECQRSTENPVIVFSI